MKSFGQHYLFEKKNIIKKNRSLFSPSYLTVCLSKSAFLNHRYELILGSVSEETLEQNVNCFCEGATVSRFMQIIKKCLVWSFSAAVFLYPITFSIDADWDWSHYLISFMRIRRIIPMLHKLPLSLAAVYRVQTVPATSPQTISPPTCCLMRVKEGLFLFYFILFY